MPLKIQRASNVVSCTLNTRKSLCRKKKRRGEIDSAVRSEHRGVCSMPCTSGVSVSQGKTISELKFWVFLVPIFRINIICSGKKKEFELKMSINCSPARAVRSGNRVGPKSWVEIHYDVTFLTSSQRYKPLLPPNGLQKSATKCFLSKTTTATISLVLLN